jgi:hypothetical protein
VCYDMFRQIAKENRMRLSAFISRAGWLTVTLLSIAVAFSAQAQPAPAAAPGEIAPYVEDTTIAIARLDLDRLNSDAAVDWEAKFLQALESDPSDTGKALRELAKPHIKQWTSEFVRAGGKTVYIVAKMNDATPAFAIVPLGLGASPKVLSEMLKDPFSGSLLAGTPTTTQPASEPPLAYLKSEVIGTALYFYPAQAFGDLHHFTEAARPELEKAFAVAGARERTARGIGRRPGHAGIVWAPLGITRTPNAFGSRRILAFVDHPGKGRRHRTAAKRHSRHGPSNRGQRKRARERRSQ